MIFPLLRKINVMSLCNSNRTSNNRCKLEKRVLISSRKRVQNLSKKWIKSSINKLKTRSLIWRRIYSNWIKLYLHHKRTKLICNSLSSLQSKTNWSQKRNSSALTRNWNQLMIYIAQNNFSMILMYKLRPQNIWLDSR